MIGQDTTLLSHVLNSAHHSQAVFHHQVRQDQSGRPAPTHHTVHQHLVWNKSKRAKVDYKQRRVKASKGYLKVFPTELTLWVSEGLVDELGRRAEVLGDVEGWFVIGLHTEVLDVHVSVVISTSQHIIKLPLCSIQHMCDTQIPQAGPLQSRFPVFI